MVKYRIEIQTDHQSRWFARVYILYEGRGFSSFDTDSFETVYEAITAASEKLKEKRK